MNPFLQAILSPATGENASALPWIIGGIGLAALIAFVLVAVLEKKKNAASSQPPVTGDEPKDAPDAEDPKPDAEAPKEE